MSHKPDIEQIEQMLSELPPEPGAGFHERMATAPWNQPETGNAAGRYRFRRRLSMAAAFFLVSVIVLVGPLRTLAQDTWQTFFQPQPEDTRTLQYQPPGQPTPTIPPAALQATLQAPIPEMTDVERQVGFNVLEPAFLPPGYALSDVYIHIADQAMGDNAPSSVMLSYSLEVDNRLLRNLVIIQREVDDQSKMPVGSSATILDVQIGDTTAQYVQGSWESVGLIEDENTGQSVIQTEWNSEIELHRLVWQMSGIYYEILFQAAYIPHPAYYAGGMVSEPGYLTLNDLIVIAESLE